MSATTRAAAVGFPILVLGAVSALVVRAAGVVVGLPWLILAALVLLVGAVTGAGLATVAFLRRDPWWGIGLLLAWPVVVPLYVGALRERRRSAEPEV